jgi:hypothetical protein
MNTENFRKWWILIKKTTYNKLSEIKYIYILSVHLILSYKIWNMYNRK